MTNNVAIYIYTYIAAYLYVLNAGCVFAHKVSLLSCASLKHGPLPRIKFDFLHSLS